MRDLREITPEDIAYQEYIGEVVSKIKTLTEAGVDTLELRRQVEAIIELIKERDYVGADYLIQLIEDDLKRHRFQHFPVEPKTETAVKSEVKEKSGEACVSYLEDPPEQRHFLAGTALKLVAVTLILALSGESLA